MREQLIERIKQDKLVVIVRGAKRDECIHLAEALGEGGVTLLEVTYNQSAPETWTETAGIIRELTDRFGDRMSFGAGTVMSTELVELTADAGGRFIVSPDTNADVIRMTLELGLVSMPGAMTPTEVAAAHRAGADFVKLFPACELGPGYVKQLKAPLSHISLFAVGGITAANARSFLDAGADGLAVGGALANRKMIDAGDWKALSQNAAEFIKLIKA